MPKPKRYRAKAALEMKLSEQRFRTNDEPLRIRTRGTGSNMAAAAARVLRAAYKHPALKHKSPESEREVAEDRILDLAAGIAR